MNKIYDYILQKETNIGLLRPTNEDSIVALVHPEDDRLRLLAVCDGMGGKEYGDVVSNYVIQKFGYWFLEKHASSFSDYMYLKEEMTALVFDCNQYFISQYGKNRVGTTLTLALVLLEDTLIIHLGDSRCYFYKNGEIKQITEDDSDVWLYYKYQHIDKEWLRYFSMSNIIHNCIGISFDACRPRFYVFPNTRYQTLLLTTDGVTDLLTDSKLQYILRNENISNVSKKIIEEAVFVDQNLFVPGELKKLNYDQYLVPVRGRDNASVVLFSKL